MYSERATQNSKTRQVLALKFQIWSNLSSIFYVLGKLELDKTLNTWNIAAKTW